jgi:hypothetical protein
MGKMGEGSEGIAASRGTGSCEAHHVGISPQEDCGVTAGTWAKVKG